MGLQLMDEVIVSIRQLLFICEPVLWLQRHYLLILEIRAEAFKD